MKRHFNSRHENMKFIPPPPPKETGYDYTPPPPPKETGYDYTPPPPPKETGYDYTPPPPPPPTTTTKETGYDYTPPPPRGPELSSLQHQTETGTVLLSLLLRRKQATTILLLLRRKLATTIPLLRRKLATTIPLLLLRRKQATTILLLLRRKLATTILFLHSVIQSCHHYNTRPKQRNRTLFTLFIKNRVWAEHTSGQGFFRSRDYVTDVTYCEGGATSGCTCAEHTSVHVTSGSTTANDNLSVSLYY